MSRNDGFDIIDLTENLEKNTEELIREVETESYSERTLDTNMYGTNRSQQNTDMYGSGREQQNADMYGSSRSQLNTDMYGSGRGQQNADMYGSSRSQLNTDMYGSGRGQRNTDMYGNSRSQQNAEVYGTRRSQLNTDMYGSGRSQQNAEVYGTGRSQLNTDMYGSGRGQQNADMYGTRRSQQNTDMYGSSRGQQDTDRYENDIDANMYEARRNPDRERYQETRRQADVENYGAQGRRADGESQQERERSTANRVRTEGENRTNRKLREEDMSGRKRGSSDGGGRGKRKPSRAERKLKRKLIKIAIIIVVLFAGAYSLVHSIVSKTNYEELKTEYVRPSDVETVNGVKNILLIGTDARSTDEDGRSDSMIILSINSKKNKIVMTSVLRDSYVEIPGHGSNRINAAYSYGQEDLLIQTIEQNFKIPIDAYAKVDFFSFIDIVDAVGGVELDLTQEEVQWVNAYLNETNELLGKEFGDGYLTSPGLQTLNGKQALSYARIRYIGTDFGRTERQRKILNAVVDKVKSNPASVSKLTSSVLPSVTTNIKDSELTMMTMKAVLYLGYDMEQFCIPADGTWKNATISGMSVLEVDFEANQQAFKANVYE